MNWTVCQQGISSISRNIWQHYRDPRCPNMFCGPSSSTGGSAGNSQLRVSLQICRLRLQASVRSRGGPWARSGVKGTNLHFLHHLFCNALKATSQTQTAWVFTAMFMFRKSLSCFRFYRNLMEYRQNTMGYETVSGPISFMSQPCDFRQDSF